MRERIGHLASEDERERIGHLAREDGAEDVSLFRQSSHHNYNV